LPGTEGGYNPAFSPTGEQLAFVAGSRRALKVLSLSGGQPITLTDSLVDNGGIAWSPDGYIYYDAHMETDGLGRVLASGGRPEVATRTDAQAGESWHSIPAALPNRRGLLFTIARQRGQSPSDVAVLDLRTGKHQVLFRGSAARYAPSGHLVYALDDGTLMAASFDANRLKVTGTPVAIASGVENRGLGRADIDISSTGLLVYAAGMSRPRVAELVWVTRDGEATAVDPNWQQNLFGSPTLSPDGKAAAVTVGSGNVPQVWIKQLDRGPAALLATDGGAAGWSPNGKEVAFYGNGAIWRASADGSSLPVRAWPIGQTAGGGPPSYSPDGQWIVATTTGNIVAFKTSGDTAGLSLVESPSLARRGTLSPDGHWLAYESDESGRLEVYVRPFPNAQSAKRQISVGGGSGPRWSRSGRELFYVDDRRDLIAVPVTLAPTFAAGVPHRLFSIQPFLFIGYDPSPDGQRFLTVRAVGADLTRPPELVVVQNFVEELRAKVPR
jgi:serine/threonine-protein kinase